MPAIFRCAETYPGPSVSLVPISIRRLIIEGSFRPWLPHRLASDKCCGDSDLLFWGFALTCTLMLAIKASAAFSRMILDVSMPSPFPAKATYVCN
ncbi:hypothetical protein V6Z11_A08G206400 [Gossypium hirsutum]